MPSRYGVIVSSPRQELYKAAFRNIYADRETRYDCSPRDIDRATHFRGRHSGAYVSPRRADYEIVEHNRLSRVVSLSERAAIHRLRSSIDWCERHRWGPDLFTKAFLNLDKVFFCSMLRDIVRVKWKRNLSRPDMAGCCMKDSTNRNSGRREIWLNADEILRARERTPFAEMFSTILHEMCHAYKITQVRQEQLERPPHGPHFGTKIRAIDNRMRHLTGLRAISASEHYQVYDCV